MPSSCSRIRSALGRRSGPAGPARATCSTSSRLIDHSSSSCAYCMRQALASHAGESRPSRWYRRPSRSTPTSQPSPKRAWRTPGAHADRPGLFLRLVALHRARRHARLLHAAGVQRQQLILGHLAEESATARPPRSRGSAGGAPTTGERRSLARVMPDVAEPPLLLDLVGIVHRARVREHALLEAGDEHRGNSSPLAECSVISVTRASASFSSSTSLTRPRRQEAFQRRLGLGVRVVLGGGDQLLEVFQAGLGLRRALLLRARRGSRSARARDR